jgi:hypothetical protein
VVVDPALDDDGGGIVELGNGAGAAAKTSAESALPVAGSGGRRLVGGRRETRGNPTQSCWRRSVA